MYKYIFFEINVLKKCSVSLEHSTFHYKHLKTCGRIILFFLRSACAKIVPAAPDYLLKPLVKSWLQAKESQPILKH